MGEQARHVTGRCEPFDAVVGDRARREHQRVDALGRYRGGLRGEQGAAAGGVGALPCGDARRVGLNREGLARRQHRAGGAETRGHGVDLLASQHADQRVGGGVVADRDHQRRQRLERHRRPRGPGLQDAGGKGRRGNWHHLVPAMLARGDPPCGFGEYPQFERGAERGGLGVADRQHRHRRRAVQCVDAEPCRAGQRRQVLFDRRRAVVAAGRAGDAQPGDRVGRGGIDRDQHRRGAAFVADEQLRGIATFRGQRRDPLRGPQRVAQLRGERLPLA
ncbi:hypothetical protein WR25_01806 [Diploscapter pachys]|uniref:Uncharacterized protein n=1 Tax=Diploscapter pachys TaxID=2018661 RepID=A0A2A2JY65_9BILA|nr:hypothetical protein WR25_01806 [Diploscapter pachys]